LTKDIGDFVVGIPRQAFFEDLDAEVSAAVESAIGKLAILASSVGDFGLPVNQDRTLQSYESYAYHRTTVTDSPQLYDPETLRRIRSGERITVADYQAAVRELKRIRSEIGKQFRDVDVFVMPTTPIPAQGIAALIADHSLLRPIELRLLRNTRPANVWGLPAISIPCGFTSSGLPIGLQIVGPPGGDAKVLRMAYAYEQARKNA